MSIPNLLRSRRSRAASAETARKSCRTRLPRHRPRRLPSAVALQREHGAADGARLSAAERAALVARQDGGIAATADWALWRRDLEARCAVC